MKTHISFLLFLLLTGLVSCKKIEEKLNLPPDDFQVRVSYRGETTAEISWDPAVDLEGDAVSYSVEVSSRVHGTNLVQTNFTVNGLVAANTYQGRVVATDAKGAQKSIAFTIYPHQEQLLISGRTLGLVSYNVDGQKAWTAIPENLVTPVVSNDTVFANDGSTLYAINLKDGSKLWQKYSYVKSGYNGITYSQGVLFFNTYLKINAVDSRNGTLLWTVPYTFVVREVIATKGVAYIAAARQLLAIDIKTGNQLWSASTTEGLFSSLVARNGVVYALSSSALDKPGSLHAFDARNGTSKWRYAFTGTSLYLEGATAPAIYGDRIYIPVKSDGYLSNVNHLHAVEVASGRLAWKKPIDTYEDISSILADENGVYFCTRDQLTKLDRDNGNVRWSVKAEFASAFTLARDRIYTSVGTFATLTDVFDTATGKVEKRINTRFEASNSPVVIKNKKVYYPVRQSAMATMEP